MPRRFKRQVCSPFLSFSLLLHRSPSAPLTGTCVNIFLPASTTFAPPYTSGLQEFDFMSSQESDGSNKTPPFLPPPSTGLFSSSSSSSPSLLPLSKSSSSDLGADFFGPSGASALLPTFYSEAGELPRTPDSPDFGAMSQEDAEYRRYSQSFAESVLDIGPAAQISHRPQDAAESERSLVGNLLEDATYINTALEESLCVNASQETLLSQEEIDTPVFFSTQELVGVTQEDEMTQEMPTQQDPEVSATVDTQEETQLIESATEGGEEETQVIATEQETQLLEPATLSEYEQHVVETPKEMEPLESEMEEDEQERRERKQEEASEQQEEQKEKEGQKGEEEGKGKEEEKEINKEEEKEADCEKQAMEDGKVPPMYPISDFRGCSPPTRARRLEVLRLQLVHHKETRVRDHSNFTKLIFALTAPVHFCTLSVFFHS
jgi:hypothetical protein